MTAPLSNDLRRRVVAAVLAGESCRSVAYSPDLNPIEQAFAKIKHCMRAAQKRTVEDIWRHVGTLVSTIDAAECANYFENAGYASVKT